jgi:hypothetical protein
MGVVVEGRGSGVAVSAGGEVSTPEQASETNQKIRVTTIKQRLRVIGLLR